MTEEEMKELQERLSGVLKGWTIEEVRVQPFSHPRYDFQVLLRLDNGSVVQIPEDLDDEVVAMGTMDPEEVQRFVDEAPCDDAPSSEVQFYIRAAEDGE